MTIVLFILWVIVLIKLIAVTAIAPHRSRFSPFELERRRSAADHTIELDARREATHTDIISLQRVLQASLLVLFTLLSVGVFGWFFGGLVAIFVSLEYAMIASSGQLHRTVGSLYDKYEPTILSFVEKQHGFIRWIRSAIPQSERQRIDSREELRYLVNDSQGILDEDEKALILATLEFDNKMVREVMTPKSVIDTVAHDEVLGPLVLDDLHKTGHSRFPVIDGDIDHIVGILYVRDVLTLDTTKRHTSRVENAMSKRVYYIREDHGLDQALEAFISTHHHLFVVINEFRETVGILTLEDTIEALLGRRIVDEFDAHDDMRAVATRNASKKTAPNRSTTSKDI